MACNRVGSDWERVAEVIQKWVVLSAQLIFWHEIIIIVAFDL